MSVLSYYPFDMWHRCDLLNSLAWVAQLPTFLATFFMSLILAWLSFICQMEGSSVIEDRHLYSTLFLHSQKMYIFVSLLPYSRCFPYEYFIKHRFFFKLTYRQESHSWIILNKLYLSPVIWDIALIIKRICIDTNYYSFWVITKKNVSSLVFSNIFEQILTPIMWFEHLLSNYHLLFILSRCSKQDHYFLLGTQTFLVLQG